MLRPNKLECLYFVITKLHNYTTTYAKTRHSKVGWLKPFPQISVTLPVTNNPAYLAKELVTKEEKVLKHWQQDRAERLRWDVHLLCHVLRRDQTGAAFKPGEHLEKKFVEA